MGLSVGGGGPGPLPAEGQHVSIEGKGDERVLPGWPMLLVQEALPGKEGFTSATPKQLTRVGFCSVSSPKTRAVMDVIHENCLHANPNGLPEK